MYFVYLLEREIVDRMCVSARVSVCVFCVAVGERDS